MFFLDNLRVFLTILVVLHHTAITYGAEGGWFYYATVSEGLEDPLTSVILTLIAAINSSFFMGAFFLLSGYFTPGSYDRKGSLVFLKDRIIRLGIPLLLFTVFISPFIYSYRAIMVFNDPRPLVELYLLTIESQNFITGPLWFVKALLIIAFGYAILREGRKILLNARKDQLSDQDNEQLKKNNAEREFPSTQWLVLLIFLLGLFTFILRLFIASDDFNYFDLPLGDFVQYLMLFVLGLVAYRQNWFNKITESHGKFWVKVTLGSIIFLIVFVIVTGAFEGGVSAFQGGFTWQSGLLLCV
jgi:hypothetical protein